jgi:hypothetical protein
MALRRDCKTGSSVHRTDSAIGGRAKLGLCSQQEKVEAPPEKPPRKQTRHSIACDGVMPDLVDGEGFEYAPVTSPCPSCSPPIPPSSSSSSVEYAGKCVCVCQVKSNTVIVRPLIHTIVCVCLCMCVALPLILKIQTSCLSGPGNHMRL